MFSYFTYNYWFDTKIDELNPNQVTKLMDLPLSERVKPHRINSDPFLTELKEVLEKPNKGLKETGILNFD